ncbi:hypothetical protein CRM22_004360 [Opisthorchis felineus]|uniref:Uncharacterized protein n=1 Tax=Opisthorchis felineus TaxID=147828 RepID=A0A4S2M1U2_OPIFE|nr:hypothetical protein CRM22_004360 [Opisthorchis felineus]
MHVGVFPSFLNVLFSFMVSNFVCGLPFVRRLPFSFSYIAGSPNRAIPLSHLRSPDSQPHTRDMNQTNFYLAQLIRSVWFYSYFALFHPKAMLVQDKPKI